MVEIINLIKGAGDIIAYVEFKQDGKVKLLSPEKFQNRFGEPYQNFMKESK